MCESTFIPLEHIRDLLAKHKKAEPTQEEYIKLRNDIENNKLVPDLPGLPKNPVFEDRLIAYGNQQIGYNDSNVIKQLERKYVTPRTQKFGIKKSSPKEQMQK